MDNEIDKIACNFNKYYLHLFSLAKIAVFVGSVRRDRKGIKVTKWIENKLQERNHKVYFIDQMDLDLPLFDRMYKEMDNSSQNL